MKEISMFGMDGTFSGYIGNESRSVVFEKTRSVPRLRLLLAAAQGKQVVRHLMMARVQDFVVHTEHVDIVEMPLHDRLQVRECLAVDVPRLADRRRVFLAL
jgi:hypothetical protein